MPKFTLCITVDCDGCKCSCKPVDPDNPDNPDNPQGGEPVVLGTFVCGDGHECGEITFIPEEN